jgi:hypothetical protein
MMRTARAARAGDVGLVVFVYDPNDFEQRMDRAGVGTLSHSAAMSAIDLLHGKTPASSSFLTFGYNMWVHVSENGQGWML